MNTFTIFKRELTSYFTQPTAYAIIVIFVLLSTFVTFTSGGFWEYSQASLSAPLFHLLPLLLMVLVPAVSMRAWSDEHYTGTIELLGTYPVSLRSAIVGKFAAAALVWLLALALTFPLIIAINSLGDPDNWEIFSGYLGSFLLCCTFLSISTLVSAFTRDQVVSLIVSVLLCCLLTLCGFDSTINLLRQSDLHKAVEICTTVGIFSHFREAAQGLIRLPSLFYFLGLIIIPLIGTNLVLKSQRA